MLDRMHDRTVMADGHPAGDVADAAYLRLAADVPVAGVWIALDRAIPDNGCMRVVQELSRDPTIYLANSMNPLRIEGQKTSAFEICDALETAPDWLCLPVGNAGNITAYWAGFKQYDELRSTGLPQVLGVQAAGSAPLC